MTKTPQQAATEARINRTYAGSMDTKPGVDRAFAVINALMVAGNLAHYEWDNAESRRAHHCRMLSQSTAIVWG